MSRFATKRDARPALNEHDAELPIGTVGNEGAIKNRRRRTPIGKPVVCLLLALVTLLCGCNQDDERRQTIAADRAAELFRITDPVHGADQLRSRILQNLKVGGAYIAIRINDSDVQVIPAATPWTLRCDYIAGISIAFTSNVTDPSGGLVMQISEARPNWQQCLEIALPIAKVLDALLASR